MKSALQPCLPHRSCNSAQPWCTRLWTCDGNLYNNFKRRDTILGTYALNYNKNTCIHLATEFVRPQNLFPPRNTAIKNRFWVVLLLLWAAAALTLYYHCNNIWAKLKHQLHRYWLTLYNHYSKHGQTELLPHVLSHLTCSTSFQHRKILSLENTEH